MFHINWGWKGSGDGYFMQGVFDTSKRQENEIIESTVIKNPDLEVGGEWYKVTGKLNEIIIEFESNPTPYTRSLTISLANPPRGYAFSVTQKSEI